MESLIDQLYSVFGTYPRPDDFAACECCMSAGEKTILLSKPLRELTADELTVYAADAFLTMGELSDFKYFLPRIIELSVREEFRWPDPEVVMGKLSLAQWLIWPIEERVIILELLKAKLTALLDDNNSDGSDLDQWICALGRCLPDPTLYLDPLLEPQHRDKLLAFIEYNTSLFTKNKLDNAFWKEAPENEQRVVTWLNQPEVRALLTEQYGMMF